MFGFNKVILIGNLTRDPELRYASSGLAVSTLRLAVNNRRQSSGSGSDDKNDVCFIDVVTFGKQAENCNQYLNKGSSILVEGRLQDRRWETPDGQKRSKHEVVAHSVTFMPKKAQANGQGYTDKDQSEPGDDSGYQAGMNEPVNLSDDEVPF